MSKLSRLERTQLIPESHDEVNAAATFVRRTLDRIFDFGYNTNAELLA